MNDPPRNQIDYRYKDSLTAVANNSIFTILNMYVKNLPPNKLFIYFIYFTRHNKQ